MPEICDGKRRYHLRERRKAMDYKFEIGDRVAFLLDSGVRGMVIARGTMETSAGQERQYRVRFLKRRHNHPMGHWISLNATTAETGCIDVNEFELELIDAQQTGILQLLQDAKELALGEQNFTLATLLRNLIHDYSTVQETADGT